MVPSAASIQAACDLRPMMNQLMFHHGRITVIDHCTAISARRQLSGPAQSADPAIAAASKADSRSPLTGDFK